MTFVPATCAKCGAGLESVSTQGISACPFCGAKFVWSGAGSGGPATQNLLRLARAALEAGNPDEAYGYFTKVLESDADSVDAWLGKAESAGLSSSLRNPRQSEVIAGVRNAIQAAPPNAKAAVADRGADIVAESGMGLFMASHAHFLEFASLDESWPEHVELSFEALAVLREALAIDASTTIACMYTVQVCESLLAGHRYYAEYEDDPGYRMHKVPSEIAADLQSRWTAAVDAIRAEDPTYVPPSAMAKAAADVAPQQESGISPRTIMLAAGTLAVAILIAVVAAR